jgi:hypothetical protein
MNDASNGLASSMFEKYGPLLSIAQLAKILNRTPDGLRMSLQDCSDYSGCLNAAKIRIGRRVYFRTLEIARLFLGSVSGD